MTVREFIYKYNPRIKEIIENRNIQPTTEERLSAIEIAIAELALREE